MAQTRSGARRTDSHVAQQRELPRGTDGRRASRVAVDTVHLPAVASCRDIPGDLGGLVTTRWTQRCDDGRWRALVELLVGTCPLPLTVDDRAVRNGLAG